MKWFIRGKEAEGFVEAKTIHDAFDEFVRSEPEETLGLLLLGSHEYFLKDNLPESVIGIRTTIPLVRTGKWSEEQAMDFNEHICGKRIV